MSNFIKRKYEKNENYTIVNFEQIINGQKIRWSSNKPFQHNVLKKSNILKILNQPWISIILGEPASGKTYQFQEYAKTNEYTHFIPLITLKEDDTISIDTKIVLIDSIDEALTQNNQKTLARELKEYILRCKKVNPKVKFVISCRFLEWSEYFASTLKEIDEQLNIYKILPLSSKDIENLLKVKSINIEEFWDFIESNHLEYLLKNILVLLYMIDEFDNYKKQSLSFIEIYKDISKKYLLKRGTEREETLGISIDILLKISSSLAIYMTFNRKSEIDVSNLDELAGELYRIDGKDVLPSELKIVLDSALFEQNENGFSFFHKSIQEYLTAYFLSERKLSLEQLKELLASDFRFYEEFEEVVIFLTNIDDNLFANFVEFDPYIFRRHPSLTKEQQEKLLLSILNKLIIDRSQAWGRWEFFYESSLVKFNKLDNLTNLLQENASLKEHGFYLMRLLENNYSNDLRVFMFELFEKNKEDIELLKGVIRGNFIDHYNFNVLLYEFLKDNGLLEYDTHQLFMSFEAELFSSLYGIKYKFKYGEERVLERTDIDFNTIVSLLDYVPASSLKYIVPYLLKGDAEKWFTYVIEQYSNKNYSPEFMSWVVYTVLKDCNSIGKLKEISKFLQEKKIYLHLADKKEIKLNFQPIEDIFWEVYFETDILQNYISKAIVSFYDLSVDDIKKATEKYPIKYHVEKYIYFRQLSKSIDDFLMQDENFKEYMQKLWKEQEEQQQKLDKEIKEELQKDNDYILRKEQEKKFRKIYEKSKTKVSSIDDVTNIFNYLINDEHSLVDNLSDLDEKLKEELGEKYNNLVTLIGEEWGKDEYYQKIKEELCESGRHLFPSLFYLYLFHVEDCLKYIKSERDYEKLFWYIYRNSLNSIEQEYFCKLTEQYFNIFIQLVTEVVKLSLECSNGKMIGDLYKIINFLKKIDRFDTESVKEIIQYLKSLDKKIFLGLNTFELEQVLEFLSLDKENYNFIYSLMIEESKCSIYLVALLKIDVSRTLDDFFSNYHQIKTNKSIVAKIKEYFDQLRGKRILKSSYDNPKINQEKIRLYQYLLKMLKQTKVFSQILPQHIQIVLTDYYEFFSEYQTPKGVYTPDIYDDMDRVINDIWKSIETKTEYIGVLKELTKMENKRLSDRAKYTLTKAYEEQKKDRIYPNSYYKRIFDMKSNEDKAPIGVTVSGDGNMIAIGSNNTQVINREKIEKKDKWWHISLVVGLFGGGLAWWQFSWMWGVGILVIIFIIMLFLNPKRRFWVAAWIVLSMAGINGFLNFIGTIKIPENPYINGIIKLGQNTNIFATLAFIVLVGVLFWLDYEERK